MQLNTTGTVWMGGGMVRRLSPTSAGPARGHQVTSAPLPLLLPPEVGHCDSSRDSVPPAPHSQQEAQLGSLAAPASPSEPGGGQELED